MLLEIALADSYGIAFEFVDDPVRHGLVNDLSKFQQNPRYSELEPSRYTDDTLRSIATAMVILNSVEHPRMVFDMASYVMAMQAVYRSDQRKGWSKNFQRYLEENVEVPPIEFMRGLTSRAASNGSIMGCLPVAYLPHIVDVKLAASIQAMSTHSAETVPYAQAMALSAHFFLNGGDRETLPDFLAGEVDNWAGAFSTTLWSQEPNPNGIGMSARETACAVLKLVCEHDSLAELLYDAVALGGDTDSVAALAVGIASCCEEYARDLPVHLIDDLDFGTGRDYLTDIDRGLRALCSTSK